MRQSLGRRGETGLVLDGVELGDPIERRFGDGRFRRLPHAKMALRQWAQQATSVIAGIAGSSGLAFRGS